MKKLEEKNQTIHPVISTQAINYDFIVETAYNDNLNRQSIPGEAKARYKYLKNKYSTANYKHQKTDKYSPGTAGLLAIVPGAGHFYINEPLRGLVYPAGMGASFLIMFGGTVMAFDGYAAGTALLLTGAASFVGLYIMNFHNAVKFTKLKNLEIRDKHLSFQVLPYLKLNNYITCSPKTGLSLIITF